MPDAALPPSIALAVLIRPSRRLRLLLLLAALAHAATAASILFSAENFAFPWLLASASGSAAGMCTAAAWRRWNVRRIDISKAGALRLTVQHKLPEHGRAVLLLPGSLLGEQLLVLRLGGVDDGPTPVRTVLVLRDSTDPASFRALSVALRAIAGRSGGADISKIG